MTPNYAASQLRMRADRCAAAIERTFDPDEKELLLWMREGLLQLAQNEDWLKGIKAL